MPIMLSKWNSLLLLTIYILSSGFPTTSLAYINTDFQLYLPLVAGQNRNQQRTTGRVKRVHQTLLRANAASNTPPKVEKACISDYPPSYFQGKRVLVRADLNVPFKEPEHEIADDTRILYSIPTLRYLLDAKAKLIIMSHMGRPKNGPEEKFSLKPVARRLGELLGTTVLMASASHGNEVENMAAGLKEGEVLLLENVRFNEGETKNDTKLAESYSRLGDIFVNDAFGAAHRAHSSTVGITKFLTPALAGLLLKKELDFLQGAIVKPERPFAAIVGGAKVSSKIAVLKSLLPKVDVLVIGGAMAFTFLKARGYEIGSSLVEDDYLTVAREIEEEAVRMGVQMILPTDVILADRYAPDATSKVASINNIQPGWMGLDNGPETTKTILEALDKCKTILWNGPMGVSEYAKFASGTTAIAKALAKLTPNNVTTIVGGGDSVAALQATGLAKSMSHVSTGGGAALELLEGSILPGVDCLSPSPN